MENHFTFSVCRDGEARQILNGTIRPLMATEAGSTGELRFCSFKIYAPENQYIRMSCSAMNFTSSGNDNINVQYSNSTYKFLRVFPTVDFVQLLRYTRVVHLFIWKQLEDTVDVNVRAHLYWIESIHPSVVRWRCILESASRIGLNANGPRRR